VLIRARPSCSALALRLPVRLSACSPGRRQLNQRPWPIWNCDTQIELAAGSSGAVAAQADEPFACLEAKCFG